MLTAMETIHSFAVETDNSRTAVDKGDTNSAAMWGYLSGVTAGYIYFSSDSVCETVRNMFLDRTMPNR